MPFFSSPQQFSIHNSEFNEAHRDINKHVTKNYNHTINSNNIGSNNITGSNNTVGSNNRPPPNLSDYIPGYEQHLMRQWGGARREYGHPYSRPDQGRSYPYSRSEEGRRSRSYQPRDVSPIDSESESELPPRFGRAQQPPQEPASEYPPPNIPGSSSHHSYDGDAEGSAQYASQPQAYNPNVQSSGPSQFVPARPNSPPFPDEVAGNNNRLNPPREYLPSPSPSPSPSQARYAPTPRTGVNGRRWTAPDDATRRNTRDCDPE